MMDSQAQQLVTVLFSAFADRFGGMSADMVKASMATYRRFLVDLDYDRANAAVERSIATSRYLPRIAEIREAALEVAGQSKRPGGDAWGDVLREIGRTGQYRLPVFDDPRVQRAVDALGWRNLCLSENAQADRARFVDLYDRLSEANHRDELVRGLPSSPEAQALAEAAAKLLKGGK